MDFVPKISDQTSLEIISITIDPQNDTVDVIRKYRERYKIQNENWRFFTGEKDTIHQLARDQLGAEIQILDGKTNLDKFIHTENVLLFDKENYLRGIYRAKGDGDLQRLLVELKTLRK